MGGVKYRFERSRNEGRFWSRLGEACSYSDDELQRLFENEHRKHPSDWLRIIRVEETVYWEVKGNRKRPK